MKFEEKGDFLTFVKCNSCFVYFLLQDDEVVYVGQTTAGLTRPFSHHDKEYNFIKVMPCRYEELDETEDYYISKYKPIYNRSRNHNVIFSLQRIKRIIREQFNMPNFNLHALKQVLRELDINPFLDEYTNTASVNIEQYNEIMHYIERRKNT
jgi:hypothetical protein